MSGWFVHRATVCSMSRMREDKQTTRSLWGSTFIKVSASSFPLKLIENNGYQEMKMFQTVYLTAWGSSRTTWKTDEHIQTKCRGFQYSCSSCLFLFTVETLSQPVPKSSCDFVWQPQLTMLPLKNSSLNKATLAGTHQTSTHTHTQCKHQLCYMISTHRTLTVSLF